MLHIIGIVISLFLSVLLFTKRGKSSADLVLAFWLFLISLHLFCYYLLASNKFLEFPYFLGLEIAMPLLHGPFFFWYTTLLTGKKIRKSYFSFHFLPPALVYIALSKFFWLSVAEKIFIYENNGVGYLGLLKIIHFAILPSGIIYIIMSIALIGEHRKNISNLVSHLEINLNWLRNLMIGMCMIWLSILFGNDIFTFTLVDLYILFIGYFGIKQVGMFTNKVIPLPANHLDMGLLGASEDIPLRSAKVKYEKSVIGDRFSSEIHFQVTQLMQQEKLFKDPDLGLNELAEQLKIHPNALSQVINTLENKNFYDYINELRVEEFKCILMQPENQKFTLLALAYEVGFNSKTSFNRNFKKKTGLSPTAYLKQQKIHLQATI